MLIEFVILPTFLLFILVFLALRTKFAYSEAFRRVQRNVESSRQQILADKDSIDAALLNGIIKADRPTTQLSNEYCDALGKLLPDSGAVPPSNWNQRDLVPTLKRRLNADAKKVGQRIQFRLFSSVVALLGVSSLLAIWRYQQLSRPDLPAATGDQSDVSLPMPQFAETFPAATARPSQSQPSDPKSETK